MAFRDGGVTNPPERGLRTSLSDRSRGGHRFQNVAQRFIVKYRHPALEPVDRD